MYARPPPSHPTSSQGSSKAARLLELMESLKTQVDAVSQEANHYKLQKEELEHKRKFLFFYFFYFF